METEKDNSIQECLPRTPSMSPPSNQDKMCFKVNPLSERHRLILLPFVQKKYFKPNDTIPMSYLGYIVRLRDLKGSSYGSGIVMNVNKTGELVILTNSQMREGHVVWRRIDEVMVHDQLQFKMLPDADYGHGVFDVDLLREYDMKHSLKESTPFSLNTSSYISTQLEEESDSSVGRRGEIDTERNTLIDYQYEANDAEQKQILQEQVTYLYPTPKKKRNYSPHDFGKVKKKSDGEV